MDESNWEYDAILDNFNNDKSLAILIIESMLKNMDELNNKVVISMEDNDLVQTKKSIHSIKGALAVFGDSSTLKRVKDTEQLIQVHGLENLKHSYKRIEDELTLIKVKLNKTLKQLKSGL